MLIIIRTPDHGETHSRHGLLETQHPDTSTFHACTPEHIARPQPPVHGPAFLPVSVAVCVPVNVVVIVFYRPATNNVKRNARQCACQIPAILHTPRRTSPRSPCRRRGDMRLRVPTKALPIRRTHPCFSGVTIRPVRDWQRSGILAYSKPCRKVCLFATADLEKAMRRFRVQAVGE